jgi:hypothetical protein
MAVAVLAQHAADRDGWCRGCLDDWNRLAPHPCSQANWASAVQAVYGDTTEQPAIETRAQAPGTRSAGVAGSNRAVREDYECDST